MEIGKVPENVLKRSVFKKLTVKRPEVLVHAGVGEDCAVLAPTENALVLSTDPITASAKVIQKRLAQLHFILRQMTLQVPVRNW